MAHTKSTRKKGHPTNAAKIRSIERSERALELRKAGLTFREIGEQTGVSTNAAYETVQRGLAILIATGSETREQVRAMELARLDRMQVALFRRAMSGEDRATLTILKIMERRARLLGLDSPVRAEVSGPAGGPVTVAHIDQLTDAQLEAFVRAQEEAQVVRTEGESDADE